jgi:anti-sigma B factor antagonist
VSTTSNEDGDVPGRLACPAEAGPSWTPDGTPPAPVLLTGIAPGSGTDPQPCVCEVDGSRVGRALVLQVSGELDLFTVPRFRSALDHYLDVAGDPVVLDLTAVTFLGAAGLQVFLSTEMALAGQGRRLRVVGSSPVVLRPIRATGLDRVLEVADTVAAALGR